MHWGMGFALAIRRPLLFLRGTFRLEDQEGNRIQVRSSKAQALFAMLATAQTGERSRVWLQAKLWSDREPEQAAQSLRTELANIRRIVQDTGILIQADRKSISLDLSTLHLRKDGEGEFLEGLDIRDEGFADWLTEQRSQEEPKVKEPLASPPTITSGPRFWNIVLVPAAPENNPAGLLERLFADMLVQNLREFFAASVVVGEVPSTTDFLITGKISATQFGAGSVAVRFEVNHPAVSHQIWSGFRTVSADVLPLLKQPDVLQLVSEISGAIEEYIMSSGYLAPNASDVDHLLGWGLRSLFAMTPDSVKAADKYFEDAYNTRPRGLYLAWRAQLRAVQLIEIHPIDRHATMEEGMFFFRQAMDLEPNNSMVLAMLANGLRQFERDDERTLYLAEQSVRLNPANPWAHWALSAARGYMGDVQAAYDGARIGGHLTSTSPYRFWWDNQRYIAAIRAGKPEEALQFAKATHFGNPEFKPPLRYLIALHANNGDYALANAAAEKLKRLEPSFSIERLFNDHTYPASVIHKSSFIRPSKIFPLRGSTKTDD